MSFKDPIRNRAAAKVYRDAHKDEVYARNQAWARANRDKMNKYQYNCSLRGPEAYMLIHARARAKRNGIEFNIEKSDIVIPEFCPYLGVKIKGVLEKDFKRSPSLDRIDPEKGYIKGNVQVISNRANTMKSNASVEELILFANNILKRHGGVL